MKRGIRISSEPGQAKRYVAYTSTGAVAFAFVIDPALDAELAIDHLERLLDALVPQHLTLSRSDQL